MTQKIANFVITSLIFEMRHATVIREIVVNVCCMYASLYRRSNFWGTLPVFTGGLGQK